MNSKKHPPHARPARRILLWAALIVAALIVGDAVVLRAQPDGQESFEKLREELNREARKENIQRRLTFALLAPYLPAGTEMTSGYRNPDDQLSLIKRMAVSRGLIPSSHYMNLGDDRTWSPVLNKLRLSGIIIAAPYTTPHGKDAAVFDMSGPDLKGIERGCRVAESKGLVKIAQIIYESKNHCIHVEIQWVNTRAFTALSDTRPRRVNLEPSSDSAGSIGSGSATASPSPEAMTPEKRRLLEEYYSLHEAAEGNPLKQIDYDNETIRSLHPLDDRDLIKDLKAEIEKHRQQASEAEREAKESETAARKQELIDSRVTAEMEGRDEDALRYAEQLAKEFSDAPEAKVAERLRARLLIKQARDAFEDANCNKCANVRGLGCESAGDLIEDALRAQPEDQQAKRLKAEIEIVRSNCRAWRTMRLILLVLFVVGLLVALYIWLRPGKYVLEGVVGPCKGEVFPLVGSRVRVGAMQDTEDKEVDIVISDREHKISRVHCLLTQSGRHWYLKDESRNGTKINDQAVLKGSHQRLEGGDEISLADEAVLVFRRR